MPVAGEQAMFESDSINGRDVVVVPSMSQMAEKPRRAQYNILVRGMGRKDNLLAIVNE